MGKRGADNEPTGSPGAPCYTFGGQKAVSRAVCIHAAETPSLARPVFMNRGLPWMFRLMKGVYLAIPGRVRAFLMGFRPAVGALHWLTNRYFPPDERLVTVASGPLLGMRLYLNLRNEKTYWLGHYESPVQQLILNAVQDGMIAYDLGANIGYYSLLLCRLVGCQGKVVAFEPLPANLERLRCNLQVNGVSNVEVDARAISDSCTTRTFLPGNDAADGRLASIPQLTPAEQERSLLVETVSIDHFVYRENHQAPQFIKMDIEQAEVAAIQGMQRLLRECAPLLLVECHSQVIWAEVRALLCAFGYEAHALTDSQELASHSPTPRASSKHAYLYAPLCGRSSLSRAWAGRTK